MNRLTQEIKTTLTHPGFYRDEAARTYKYHNTIELGYRICELPSSPEGLAHKWDFINLLSIIQFYLIEDSLVELMRIRGMLIEQCLRSLAKLISVKAGTNPKKKILIFKPGLNPGPELSSTVAHFKHLPKQFDVTIACQIVPSRSISNKLTNLGFQLALLPETLHEIVSAVVNYAPDIIIYSSNQSAVTNIQTLLGGLRIAPIQIATTMSPTTTGLKQIDFYLTGKDNEPPGYAARYTESPLFVNGDINHYEPSFIEETAFRENNYSIKEATGYRDLFVGGNLNKIGELSLKNWYDILAAVEDTRLIIAPFNPNWQSEYNVTDFKAWLDQLAEENSIRRERIVLIGPFPTRKPILDHIAKATLYLDSFPYSGAVSIMDPILTNTAFITIKGEQARFRQASLMAARYPALGISTDSSTAYTNKAIETLSAKAFSTNSEITEALQAESVDTSSTLAAEVASIIEYL